MSISRIIIAFQPYRSVDRLDIFHKISQKVSESVVTLSDLTDGIAWQRTEGTNTTGNLARKTVNLLATYKFLNTETPTGVYYSLKELEGLLH